MATKDLTYYMGLLYTYTLIPDLEDGGFVIKVNELPGCMSQGDTSEEAMTRIREAMEVWIESRIEGGRPVPEPGKDEGDEAYSGKFNVRLPRQLHKALATTAEREGVSLNLLVATMLAGAVGVSNSRKGKKTARG
jgi:antitoxin HicB